jgi:hypothetical protein
VEFDVPHLIVIIAFVPFHQLHGEPLADRIYDPGEVMLEKEDTLLEASLQGSTISMTEVIGGYIRSISIFWSLVWSLSFFCKSRCIAVLN